MTATPFIHCSDSDIAALEAVDWHRRAMAALLVSAPHDGRPTMPVRVASTVNGQEVRAAERGTPSTMRTLRDGRPIVSHCVSITVSTRRRAKRGTAAAIAAARGAGRQYVEFTPARRTAGRTTKQTSKQAHGAAYAERLDRFGAIGNGATD